MAAVGTGPLITRLTPNMDIGNIPSWHVFHVDGQAWDFSDEPTESASLITNLPIGTYMIDASICCYKAAAATGTDTLDIQLALDAGARKVFTGTADNGGAIDVMDRGVVVDASAFPTAEVTELDVLRTISADTGTGTADAAEYIVAVLLVRPTRP